MANVLIAVDSSEQAENAFKWYLKTLHRPEFNVILLNCLEVFFDGDYSRNVIETVRQEVENESMVLKEKLLKVASEAGVSCKWMGRFTSTPGKSIVDIAAREKAAFIVTGSRGMGAIKRAIFGSVSGHVVHHAGCPVLVYKTEES